MIYDILYPYQQEAADGIITGRRKAIFDDPGLGKTLTVLGALQKGRLFENGAKTLVLATRTGAALTWLPHADKYVPEDVLVVDAVRKSIAARRAFTGAALRADAPALVIANHDFIALGPNDREWKNDPIWKTEWDAIIVDESQRVLPTKAQHDLALTRFWRGLYRLPTHPMTMRVPMSGTPDRGKMENRYGTWMFVLPEVYSFEHQTYEQWLYRNFRLEFKKDYIRVRGRAMQVLTPVVKGLKDEHAWHSLDDKIVIRRTKAEVAPQLPPKRYVDIELPFTLKQERAYLAYLDEFHDDGTTQAAGAFTIRATQFAITEFDIKPGPNGTTVGTPVRGAESPKRDWIIEWLEERGYDLVGEFATPHGKVVITSQFKTVLKWLAAELIELGYDPVMLTGDMTTEQRLESQTLFQAPNSGRDIMLLSMTLGDSIDLDAADDMIFIDRVHDPDRVTQAEDRVHRVSRNHNVVIWRLITVGSVDEAIDITNERRFNTTREHMDGRRGVDFARKVLARFVAGKE
jgi:Superfamily II DNA/RNA helicases, SNF2 family